MHPCLVTHFFLERFLWPVFFFFLWISLLGTRHVSLIIIILSIHREIIFEADVIWSSSHEIWQIPNWLEQTNSSLYDIAENKIKKSFGEKQTICYKCKNYTRLNKEFKNYCISYSYNIIFKQLKRKTNKELTLNIFTKLMLRFIGYEYKYLE